MHGATIQAQQAAAESHELEETKDQGDGMILRQTTMMSANEVKLLFKPYTRDDLQKILRDLLIKHLRQIGLKEDVYGELVT